MSKSFIGNDQIFRLCLLATCRYTFTVRCNSVIVSSANGALQPTEVDVTAMGTSNELGETETEAEQEETVQEEDDRPSVVSPTSVVTHN